MSQKKFQFDIEKLDVFRASVEFVRFVRGLERCFVGDADRKRQLWRAADSIALNIAEGAALGRGNNQRRYYRTALGSASECVAVLVILEAHGRSLAHGRELLARIGAMLWRLVR